MSEPKPEPLEAAKWIVRPNGECSSNIDYLERLPDHFSFSTVRDVANELNRAAEELRQLREELAMRTASHINTGSVMLACSETVAASYNSAQTSITNLRRTIAALESEKADLRRIEKNNIELVFKKLEEIRDLQSQLATAQEQIKEAHKSNAIMRERFEKAAVGEEKAQEQISGLREACEELLQSHGCWFNNEPEIAEELSGQFDITLELARKITAALANPTAAARKEGDVSCSSQEPEYPARASGGAQDSPSLPAADELIRDRKRLDWLEANGCWNLNSRQTNTWRTAIDAAMKETKP